MTPLVWLFRLDATLVRIIQRDVEGQTEIVVLGSEGLRKRQLFETKPDAEAFRGVLATELVGNGFQMTWTNVAGGSTTA